MPLGMEVGLSPGDFVLHADPDLPPQKWGQSPLLNFWPISVVVKQLQYRCMHQYATWYGGRPQPRGLCVRWETSPPPKFSAQVYYSYCDFVRTLYKAQSLLVYSMHSIFRKVLSYSCSLFQLNTLCTVAPHGADSGSRSC